MTQHTVSDELLNSFVDNELDADEQNRLFTLLAQDGALNARACKLHSMKKMLQHAYPLPTSAPEKIAHKARIWPPSYGQCIVAGVMLLVLGGSSGWMISNTAAPNTYPKMARLLNIIQNDNAAQASDKIIVQISSANPVRLQAALDETEHLLDTYQHNHHAIQIEILANGGGLNLLRTGVSPFEQRVNHMQARYPNLRFVACEETINTLRQQGVHVTLLPNTLLALTALGEINKRVHQGWDFVRV